MLHAGASHPTRKRAHGGPPPCSSWRGAGCSLPQQAVPCRRSAGLRQQANEQRQGAAGRLEPRPALPRRNEAAVAGRFSRCAPLLHTAVPSGSHQPPAAYLPLFAYACIRAGKELNARRSPKQAEAAVASTSAPASAPAPPSGGSSRGEKFRAIKAREAASRAVKQVGGAACGGASCACGWLHGLQGVRRQSGAAKQVGFTCRYGCGCLGWRHVLGPLGCPRLLLYAHRFRAP